MKVAVFGAGTMGSGIAQTFAKAGNEETTNITTLIISTIYFFI